MKGHQNKVINEMVGSEKTYNDRISLLKDVYQKNPYFDPSLAQLISSLTRLKTISDDLLINMASSIENKETTSEETKSKDRIARLKLIEAFFDTYLNYVKLYDNFIKEHGTPTHQEIFKFFDDALLNQSPKVSFASLLIEPIQRGPRYKLLINEALKQKTTDINGELIPNLTNQNIAELENLNVKIGELLENINSSIPKPTPAAVAKYQFGDYVIRPAFSYFFSKPDNYKFGDYTKSLLSRFWHTNPNSESQEPDDIDVNDFHPVALDKQPNV